MKKVLNWLDENSLFLWACVLIIFIPLWPKIPLFQPIPNYIVRVRFEDILIGLAGATFLIQLLRGKVTLRTPLTIPIIGVLAAGLVSVLSAIWILPTIPDVHPHTSKAVLHLLRYTEYFFLFFLTVLALDTTSKRRHWFGCLLATVVGTVVFGMGQLWLGWPVFSTMNAFFSQGIALELVSSAARVPSTFAGHYDFSIFLGLVLPIVLVKILTTTNKLSFLTLSIVWFSGVWGVLASGLRVGFVAFVLSSFLVATIAALSNISTILHTHLGTFEKNKYARILFNLLLTNLAILSMLVLFGQNLLSLLDQVPRLWGHGSTQAEEIIIDQFVLPQPIDPTLQAENVTIKPEDAQLSPCALTGELSMCVRLERLWPQAIDGFMTNPLVGSGYSSLNKRDFLHLSEADGTDNMYLRVLGETGLVGLLAWGMVFGLITTQLVKNLRCNPTESDLAFAGSLSVLLITGLLFDVLAASKIALVWWALVGWWYSHQHD